MMQAYTYKLFSIHFKWKPLSGKIVLQMLYNERLLQTEKNVFLSNARYSLIIS